MKTSTKNVIFSQELIDHLIESFDNDNSKITRLSSPLSNLNLESNEGDEN